MERVAFLIEDTGERIGCLLNPESIEVRRSAGARRRTGNGGPLVTDGLSDDPVLATGGGSTELRLCLLFDLAVEGADRAMKDVRRLTRPLWNMAEGSPPAVRFIWGKTWNVPGVVTAAAERLEQFDAGGAPRRSWLTLRLLRIAEAPPAHHDRRKPPTPEQLYGRSSGRGGRRGGGRRGGKGVVTRELAGDGSGRSGERLDQVARAHYGDPAYWRLLASSNGIADPMAVPAGTTLHLPDAGASP